VSRRDFLADAERLGRQVAPDLATARGAVGRRAAERRAARLRSITAGGRGRLPSLAAAAVLAAVVGGVLATTPRTPATRGSVARVEAAAPPCAADRVTVELAFDHDSYSIGQPVQVSMVLRNASAAACTVAVDACASGLTVSHPIYGLVYASDRRVAASGCGAGGPRRTRLAPGAEASLAFTWDQSSCASPPVGCPGMPAGPGRYVVVGTWSGSDTVTSLPRHLLIG
jgi:hypothetical protein